MAEQALKRAAPPARPQPRRHEVLAVAAFSLAVLVILALASFHDRDVIPGANGAENLIGPVGAHIAFALYTAFGYASYALAGLLAVVGLAALTTKTVFTWRRAIGFALLFPTIALLTHLTAGADPEDVGGGRLGLLLGDGLRGLVHDTGAWIVATATLLLGLLFATPLSLVTIGRFFRGLGRGIGQWATIQVERLRRRRSRARKKDGKEEPAPEEEDEEIAALEARVDRAMQRSKRGALPPPLPPPEPLPEPVLEVDVEPETAEAPKPPPPPSKRGRVVKVERVPVAEPPPEEEDAPLPPPASAAPSNPVIVEPRNREKPVETTDAFQRELQFPLEGRSWTLPALSHLEYDETSRVTFDREELMRSAERLTRALQDFKIEGRVAEIHPGPVITMFEFEPAAGTKVKAIQALEDDLALALQALKVRIAPIPGKGVLGIEVANRDRETVFLKEIIGAEKFRKMQTKLPLALGKDISGQPIAVDLAKMPHLLVAGTTGSGKSVGLNAMLISLLYTSTPEDVRIILVDQKTTEFGPYDGVPHLLLPVVVDPKRAAVALRWGVEEMERRYALMSELGVRHIGSYNKKVEMMKEKGAIPPRPPPADGEEVEEAPPLVKLPYILIMIDELADLMMVAPREVETSLQRLAQMARAAGLHIVVATQRPSVDVISGVIRANFPARIAFQTRTRTDSRTILDDGGAEQLLGQGDMLFLPPGTSTLSRIHGAFVSDAEVKRVADFWREQGRPEYDASILQVRDEDAGAGGEDDEATDEMWDQAIAVVAETRQVSVSMLQRRLRVGYNRAARMVERMEREGMVGPADGTKPREVYVQPIDA